MLATTTSAVEFDWLQDSHQAGDFVQQKHLKILNRPFITKGKYQYNKEAGLIWQTISPSQSELNISSEGVFEVSSDGNKKLLTNDTRFSQLLLAIFGGDQEQLLAQFEVSSSEGKTVLVPIDEQVSALFSDITLTLDKNTISEINLNEPNGNSTLILLTPNSDEKVQD